MHAVRAVQPAKGTRLIVRAKCARYRDPVTVISGLFEAIQSYLHFHWGTVFDQTQEARIYIPGVEHRNAADPGTPVGYRENFSVVVVFSPRVILLRELPPAQPVRTKVVLDPLVACTFVDTEQFSRTSHGEIREVVTRESWRRPGFKCRSF